MAVESLPAKGLNSQALEAMKLLEISLATIKGEASMFQRTGFWWWHIVGQSSVNPFFINDELLYDGIEHPRQVDYFFRLIRYFLSFLP